MNQLLRMSNAELKHLQTTLDALVKAKEIVKGGAITPEKMVLVGSIQQAINNIKIEIHERLVRFVAERGAAEYDRALQAARDAHVKLVGKVLK